MKKYLLILLTSMITSVCYSHQSSSNPTDQCLLNVPVYTKHISNRNLNTQPVRIKANQATINYSKHALFSGNVNIEQGNNTLTADEVQLIQRQERNNRSPQQVIIATGNVNYFNNEIKLQGHKALSNFNTKDIDVYQGNYQMVGRQGRGNADIMKQCSNNRYIVLENGSFTSCPPGDDSWIIVGSKVIHDRKKQVAKIWNARFKVGKFPVFYSPYFQIPVGDKYRSGFLVPNIKYSINNGFELSVPYYLNLAPNYDATIIPNYISKRGTHIQTEFRYLTVVGEGLTEFDRLPKDRVYSSKHKSNNDMDRWLFSWHHNGIIDQVWHFDIDYTKVSDSDYFNDIDSRYGNAIDSYGTQKLSISYTDTNWDCTLSYKQFQIFDANSSNAYRVAPQLHLIYYQNDIGPFNLKIFSQAAKFTNINSHYPQATRFHIEPTLHLAKLINRWGNINTEAKLMATYYQQKHIDYYNENTANRHLKGSVYRVLPQFKTDGEIRFERNMDYALDYIQTIEPKLQYVYAPYRNQNNIGIYDSTILQTDYLGLFRDRTYSGLDRIASANQLSGGIITRIYDDQHIERFNASIGQIYYFSQPRTGDITNIFNNYKKTGSLIWVGNSYWRISDQWGIHGGLQYNSRLNIVTLCDTVLEYRCNENRIFQLNYHYANPQYLEKMLSDISYSDYQQGISQVGITGNWPVVNQWSLVGTYYYNIKDNQPASQLIGLQYNTCCWAINIGYKREITGWSNIKSSNQSDKKVLCNIELRGLSSNYDSSTANKIFSSAYLPYGRLS